MRIGNYGQIQQIYNTTKITGAPKTAKKGFSDMISISSTVKDAQSAQSVVKAAPDVRKDLISSIKERINAGTYDVSAEDFANKLMGKYSLEY